MSQAVMGDFGNGGDAERAVAALRAAGIPPADISVIFEQQRTSHARGTDRDDVLYGALTGGASGAILGGLAGWVLSLGAFDMFGIGRLAAEYAAGATVGGAAIGAALLGLLGAVAGLTFDDERETTVQEADVLVTVRAVSAPSEGIEAVMRENNALNVQRTDGVPDSDPGDTDASYAPGSLPHGAPEAGEARTSGGAASGTPTVRPGQHVLTLDNEKLGEVGDTSGDYFTVKRGFLHGDLYVPFESVSEMRPDTVYVNATMDEVDLKNWSERPLHRDHTSEGPTRP